MERKNEPSSSDDDDCRLVLGPQFGRKLKRPVKPQSGRDAIKKARNDFNEIVTFLEENSEYEPKTSNFDAVFEISDLNELLDITPLSENWSSTTFDEDQGETTTCLVEDCRHNKPSNGEENNNNTTTINGENDLNNSNTLQNNEASTSNINEPDQSTEFKVPNPVGPLVPRPVMHNNNNKEQRSISPVKQNTNSRQQDDCKTINTAFSNSRESALSESSSSSSSSSSAASLQLNPSNSANSTSESINTSLSSSTNESDSNSSNKESNSSKSTASSNCSKQKRKNHFKKSSNKKKPETNNEESDSSSNTTTTTSSTDSEEKKFEKIDKNDVVVISNDDSESGDNNQIVSRSMLANAVAAAEGNENINKSVRKLTIGFVKFFTKNAEDIEILGEDDDTCMASGRFAVENKIKRRKYPDGTSALELHMTILTTIFGSVTSENSNRRGNTEDEDRSSDSTQKSNQQSNVVIKIDLTQDDSTSDVIVIEPTTNTNTNTYGNSSSSSSTSTSTSSSSSSSLNSNTNTNTNSNPNSNANANTNTRDQRRTNVDKGKRLKSKQKQKRIPERRFVDPNQPSTSRNYDPDCVLTEPPSTVSSSTRRDTGSSSGSSTVATEQNNSTAQDLAVAGCNNEVVYAEQRQAFKQIKSAVGAWIKQCIDNVPLAKQSGERDIMHEKVLRLLSRKLRLLYNNCYDILRNKKIKIVVPVSEDPNSEQFRPVITLSGNNRVQRVLDSNESTSEESAPERDSSVSSDNVQCIVIKDDDNSIISISDNENDDDVTIISTQIINSDDSSVPEIVSVTPSVLTENVERLSESENKPLNDTKVNKTGSLKELDDDDNISWSSGQSSQKVNVPEQSTSKESEQVSKVSDQVSSVSEYFGQQSSSAGNDRIEEEQTSFETVIEEKIKIEEVDNKQNEKEEECSSDIYSKRQDESTSQHTTENNEENENQDDEDNQIPSDNFDAESHHSRHSNDSDSDNDNNNNDDDDDDDKPGRNVPMEVNEGSNNASAFVPNSDDAQSSDVVSELRPNINTIREAYDDLNRTFLRETNTTQLHPSQVTHAQYDTVSNDSDASITPTPTPTQTPTPPIRQIQTCIHNHHICNIQANAVGYMFTPVESRPAMHHVYETHHNYVRRSSVPDDYSFLPIATDPNHRQAVFTEQRVIDPRPIIHNNLVAPQITYNFVNSVANPCIHAAHHHHHYHHHHHAPRLTVSTQTPINFQHRESVITQASSAQAQDQNASTSQNSSEDTSFEWSLTDSENSNDSIPDRDAPTESPIPESQSQTQPESQCQLQLQSQSQPQHHQLQPQHHQMQPQHHQLQPQHHQLQTQHHQLQTQHHQLQTQHHQLQTQHHQLQPQHHQIQQQHHQFQSQPIPYNHVVSSMHRGLTNYVENSRAQQAAFQQSSMRDSYRNLWLRQQHQLETMRRHSLQSSTGHATRQVARSRNHPAYQQMRNQMLQMQNQIQAQNSNPNQTQNPNPDPTQNPNSNQTQNPIPAHIPNPNPYTSQNQIQMQNQPSTSSAVPGTQSNAPEPLPVAVLLSCFPSRMRALLNVPPGAPIVIQDEHDPTRGRFIGVNPGFRHAFNVIERLDGVHGLHTINSEDDAEEEEDPVANAMPLQELVDSTTVIFFYDGSTQEERCNICLCDYIVNEILRRLPCFHTYHRHCIDQWLSRERRTCPNCRTYLSSHLSFPNPDNNND